MKNPYYLVGRKWKDGLQTQPIFENFQTKDQMLTSASRLISRGYEVTIGKVVK
jgi:hypothetical protein